jgi:hypothetical protein
VKGWKLRAEVGSHSCRRRANSEIAQSSAAHALSQRPQRTALGRPSRNGRAWRLRRMKVRRQQGSPTRQVLLVTVTAVATLVLFLVGVPRKDVRAGQKGSASKSPPSYDPEVAIQVDDHAEIRKRFRTKLTRRGPSPQKERMVHPPEGVSVIEFPSADLRLKAWINIPAVKEAGRRPAIVFLHGGFGFGKEDWEDDQAVPRRRVCRADTHAPWGKRPSGATSPYFGNSRVMNSNGSRRKSKKLPTRG